VAEVSLDGGLEGFILIYFDISVDVSYKLQYKYVFWHNTGVCHLSTLTLSCSTFKRRV